MKALRISFVLVLTVFLSQVLSAQTMAELFVKMPQHLLPGISEETRKDLVDFQKNNMKAVMPAYFGGKIELNTLSDDYLLLTTSNQGTIQLKRMPLKDNTFALLMLQTVGDLRRDTRLQAFDPQWKPVKGIALPTLKVRDFIREKVAADSGKTDLGIQLPARLFVAYYLEPSTTVLNAVSALKNDLSLEQKGKIEPYLTDTLRFSWKNGTFERFNP